MKYVSPTEPPLLNGYVYSAFAGSNDRIQPADQVTRIYSPERVEKWFRRWELLDGLVDNPSTALHHLTNQHERYASRMVPNTPCPPPKGGGWSMSHHFAEIRADIEGAVARLPEFERSVVQMVSEREMSLSDVAKTLRKNKGTVLAAYKSAVSAVSKSLGWTPDEEN